MKILLLSDTHGFIDDKILSHAQWADEVWHAGDIGSFSLIEKLSAIKPVRAVYGNIDGQEIRSRYKQDERFVCNGLSVFMTHIGGYPAHYDARVKKLLDTNPPQLFICGHSHILRVMRDDRYNMLVMNPGAAGISGFHKIRTMLRFSVENGNILQPEVIELGNRATIV